MHNPSQVKYFVVIVFLKYFFKKYCELNLSSGSIIYFSINMNFVVQTHKHLNMSSSPVSFLVISMNGIGSSFLA